MYVGPNGWRRCLGPELSVMEGSVQVEMEKNQDQESCGLYRDEPSSFQSYLVAVGQLYHLVFQCTV